MPLSGLGASMNVETARAQPRSPVSATITARGHTMVQDKPADLGGEDKGPMASEHLLAAVLACQLSTFGKVAAKRRLDHVRAVGLDGELRFDEAGDIREVALTWHLEGAGEEPVESLLRLTDRACTISKALRVPVVWQVA